MSTTTDGCSSGQQRPTTCSDACVYEASGACTTPSDGLGEACTPGSCEAGLICNEGTEVAICREPCTSDAECTDPRLCFTGDMVCSDVCTPFTDDGCPSGSKCDFLGYSGVLFDVTPYLVCSGVGTLPAGATCTTNWQCQREHVCVLEEAGGDTGRCTELCDSEHPCSSGTCDVGTSGGTLGFCRPAA
jgi:hypothetical protein